MALGFMPGVRSSWRIPASPSATKIGSASKLSLGESTRPDFPILHQTVNGRKLIYLDNAATSQKPLAVLDSLKEYYNGYNSNVHRGVHTLSTKATEEYEGAREKIRKFINAESFQNVVFTRNATEAINLVALSWGLSNLQPDDEIVLSVAEHHSNIVPWQIVSQKTGAVLKYVSVTKEDETLDINQLKSCISKKTKLVCLQHVSNVLGSINPIKEITSFVHENGAKVLVDACQSVPHMPIDVQDLDADFLVFSSHKMCGPTGIGVLYGKLEILMAMPPLMGGGEMISEVSYDHSTYLDPPTRFEAGTPAIAEAIGLGAAVDYLSVLGMQNIHEYELELGKYLHERLSGVSGIRIYGPEKNRAALCSFNVEGVHAFDLSSILDEQHGVAVRSGHHCAQLLHKHLGTNASARASLYFYNTKQEVDTFIDALVDSISFFK